MHLISIVLKFLIYYRLWMTEKVGMVVDKTDVRAPCLVLLFVSFQFFFTHTLFIIVFMICDVNVFFGVLSRIQTFAVITRLFTGSSLRVRQYWKDELLMWRVTRIWFIFVFFVICNGALVSALSAVFLFLFIYLLIILLNRVFTRAGFYSKA